MINKLTLQNLHIANTINNDGQFIRTPEPSEMCEVEHELKYMYLLADWLLWASKNHKITTKKYIAMAEYFDTLPTVGQYFRKICEL